MDTIFAEATPPGRGGVSVIRLSGPQAHALVAALAGPVAEPRRLVRRALRDGDEVLDDAMVVVFAAGASFTGEASAELHLHGAPTIVARVGQALRDRGARLAEPGEFTRRAFLNGRIDLTEIEGLGDLLAAETEAQRVQALALATGALRAETARWREMLIEIGALIAAEIDFPDEGLGEARDPAVARLLAALRVDLDRELTRSAAAQALRRGFEVAIIGAPNVGKSSLLNAIARRDVAIVSDVPGTTRDVLELRLDLDGLPVTLLDTAGLRETDDAVEAIGVARARSRADAADLRIALTDGNTSPEGLREGDIVLVGKADLREGDVSSVTGDGVAELLERIGATLRGRYPPGGLISHDRQRIALLASRAALAVDPSAPPELLADAVREATVALARLVGAIDVDDYLDVVFSRFCIGK